MITNDLKKLARYAVRDAHFDPGLWRGLRDYAEVEDDFDEIVFDNGVFTIGSQGDYDDYDQSEHSAEQVAEILATCWEATLQQSE